MTLLACLHRHCRLCSALALAALVSHPAAAADWTYEVIDAGASVTHKIAVVHSEHTEAELEFFTSQGDPDVALALYVPEHHFPLREAVSLTVQVEDKGSWTLSASRHAMALVVSKVPEALLKAVAQGRRVSVVFPGLEKARHEERFSLQGSARALRSLRSTAATSQARLNGQGLAGRS